MAAMTIEHFKQRPSTIISVCIGLLAVVGIGVFVAVSESRRPPASAFDGEWLWVSSYGGYFERDIWYPTPGDTMVLTLSRGRYRVESPQGQYFSYYPDLERGTTVFEGSYTFLDTTITSTWGFVGRPVELSSSFPDHPLVFVPEVRGDTLTLHCYVDDGSDFTFVRRE